MSGWFRFVASFILQAGIVIKDFKSRIKCFLFLFGSMSVTYTGSKINTSNDLILVTASVW